MDNQLSDITAFITGGAGFIGSNLAKQLLSKGAKVIVYDNLSRCGVEENLAWLQQSPNYKNLTFIKGDLCNFEKLSTAMNTVDRVYHLAGQVAVTTSVSNPRLDFEANALGTLNVLEAARHSRCNPIFLYSSTNKVYGEIENVEISEEQTRYVAKNYPYGISETQSLDFHSPYGCSKGAGDQYVRDYSRIYGLRTIVLRQSCIYGYRQFGIEDQGWLAWFMIAIMQNRPITIFGNGKQVRDVLFIEDLLNAYELAIQSIDITSGQIYNIGGGPQNTISVWHEFGSLLEELFQCAIPVQHADWRPGDQHVYISDIRKAYADFSWKPQICVKEGVKRLHTWLCKNRHMFRQ